MSDNPSGRIVAAASEIKEITDAQGRKIKVRQLDALARFDLMDALGSGSASNEMLLGYAALAACVVEIDGIPVPPMRDKKAVRAAVARLGNDGLAAVAEALKQPDETAPADE